MKMNPKALIAAVESTVSHPINSLKKHPLKTAAVALGAFVLVDYLVAPKGHSYASKALDAVHPKKLLGAVRSAGTFGGGWGRGNMPLMYGNHYPQTPADVSHAHMAWQAAAGQPGAYYAQSQYPWA